MKTLKKTIMASLLLCSSFAVSAVTEDLSARRAEIYASWGRCDQAVFSDENYFAATTSMDGQTVRVASLHGTDEKTFSFPSRVHDLKILGQTLYVLTGDELHVLDIPSADKISTRKTRPNANLSDWRQTATGFVMLDRGQRALISHGVLGLSLLDVMSGQTRMVALPKVTSAQDLAILDNDHVLVAVDNDTDAAFSFRGIFVVDLNTWKVSHEMRIDNAFPQSVRVLPGDRLMLGFLNSIWRFDLAKALKDKSPTPSRRNWKFPGLSNTDITGKVHFDDSRVFGCFDKKPTSFFLKDLKFN